MMSKKAEYKNEKLNQKTQLKKSIQMQEDGDMSDDLDNDEEMDSGKEDSSDFDADDLNLDIEEEEDFNSHDSREDIDNCKNEEDSVKVKGNGNEIIPINPGVKMLFLEESNRRRQREAKLLYVNNLPEHVSHAEMKSLSGDIQHSVHFVKDNTRYTAILHFESEEKAEENFKLLQGKTFKDRILSVDYMGDKSKHIDHYPKSYDMKTLLLPLVPFNCTVHEVAQHFPSCSQVLLVEKFDKFARINFQKKQDANAAFLANKSVIIKDMEIPVLHYLEKKKKKRKKKNFLSAGRRFKEEFNNRSGFRGRFSGSPRFRGGTQVHIGFRRGRGGFGRGFIARGNGFKGAELGGGRGVRRAERGSGRGFHRDGPDAGGRFKEEFNNRGGFRGRFGGSPSFRGGIQGHIGFRGGRGGFGRGFIARGRI